MSIRIVVASEATARFYEIAHRHQLQEPEAPLQLVGELTDPAAHLHDRDFQSDRPGRSFDRAPLHAGRRGATAHHATGDSSSPRVHEAEQFARRIAAALVRSDRGQPIERLVLVAAPRFLGMLRAALPRTLHERIADEIHHDLARAPLQELRAHLSAEVDAGRL